MGSVASDLSFISLKWSLLLFQAWPWIKVGGRGEEKNNSIIPFVVGSERHKECF